MKLIAAVVALALLLKGAAHATTLLYATPYSPNHPFSRADRVWIDWVEKQSGGELRIRAVWSGGLLSSDQSLIELRHGVADIGLITPIYAHGGAQMIRAQSGFYGGARTFEEQTALYRCLAAAEPEFARELSGLTILAVQGGTLPGILTRSRPVNTLGDLRGLRLRAPTELLGVLRDLGVDPVNMPMGDVYSALAKGVLDGVVAPADTLKSLHFAEVGKYFWRLEIPRGAYPARAISTRRWNSLTPQERSILEQSTVVWEAAIASQTLAAVRAGESAGAQEGVHFTPVRPEDQRVFDALYEKDGERAAASLVRFGIDGPEVFQRARGIASKIRETGRVDCLSGHRERGAAEIAGNDVKRP
jgi:TRAP-type C4-dicarboxylate transport system substrate-binding protein